MFQDRLPEPDVARPQIVRLLRWECTEGGPDSAYKLYLPLLAITLSDLLDDPFFAPASPSKDFAVAALTRRDPLDGREDRADVYHAIAASLLLQTASGLAHLHMAQIAHRDVKPDNIVLDWDGTVRIIDFGVAWTRGRDLPCAVGSGWVA